MASVRDLMTVPPFDLSAHVALVTGANHGIGEATARMLATCGARVLITYLRIKDEVDPGIPEIYRRRRSANADDVLAEIRAAGGQAISVEADLADGATAMRLFDLAEAELGPIDILVNNASGWLADTFTAEARDHFGRGLVRVSAETFERQFSVDARGSAALIAEFARRHIDRKARWGRIVGLTSGGPGGFPGEVSYGAAKAALENYTMSAAVELASVGVTANIVHPPVTDTGWVTEDVRRHVEGRQDLVHIAEPNEVARSPFVLVSLQSSTASVGSPLRDLSGANKPARALSVRLKALDDRYN
jgi:3-oxoacyl-[acyl-carrier protein] reductase